uniref:Ubiquitin carboxyl-terminal hydrolase 14 n=1 Tax=Schistocephalus solidus TaxID=70667 RepID=A0A0X3P022_SCHSO
MPVYKLNVKWKKQKFTDVECDTNEPPGSFKAVLFSLTGVPPERQNVMMPGGILGDANYDGIKLRDGVTIMLMGTAEEIPPSLLSSSQAPIEPAEIHERKLRMPIGIVNLGNTCYMNGTLQLLFLLPELRDALSVVEPSRLPPSMNENSKALVTSMRFLFQSMEKAEKAVIPVFFLKALHSNFPQFATTASNAAVGQLDPTLSAAGLGMPVYQQQDANECWTEVVRILQKVTVDSSALQNKPGLPQSFGTSGGWNPIDRYLTGQLTSTLTCTEGEEPAQQSVDTFTQLSCFIDKEVKYLHTGIRNGLEGTLTKNSDVLGREAVYKKISRVSRLPGYLCVQFVRFYYKEKEHINAKILKDIKFPLNLDLYEFCAKDLQEKLLPAREKVRIEEDEEALSAKAKKLPNSVNDDNVPNPIDNPDLYEPYWFEDDPGSNNTGFYELQGVLTHQGRSSTSGHYVSWIKKKGKWFKLDDDTVSEVGTEDIMKLSGGGDWHCAYLLLYGPRRIKIRPARSTTAVGGSAAMETSKPPT